MFNKKIIRFLTTCDNNSADHFRFYFAKMLRGRARERTIITTMRVKLTAKILIIAWTLMKRKGAV